jgi:hypothetical protein
MVSAAGLAKRLGLAASTVRQYAREGRIPVALRTPGGHGRFIVDEAQAALANGNEAKAQSANTPLARRSFAPVPTSGEGELRFNAEAEPLQIADDWQLRLAVGSVRVGADDFGDLEPDPVVGVADGARFVLDHDQALVGV